MANTQVILLQRVENLGQMGDVVAVKPGYARNFLLPQNKALRANKSNIAYFEAQKKVLEAANQTKKADAEKVAKKMGDFSVVIIRQAAEGGQLYGSVTTRDIAEAAAAAGVTFDRSQVYINQAYKTLGLFGVDVFLHPEVKVTVTINIARSEEEAKVQKKLGRAVVADAEGKLNTAPTTDAKADLLEGSAYATEQAEAAAAAAAAEADAAVTAEKSAKRAAKKATKKADDVAEGDAETETTEDAAE